MKVQSIVKGSLAVLASLATHLAQGIFATGPKAHPLGIHFAGEPPKLQDDRAPGSGCLGMKVFSVDGEFMVPGGEHAHAELYLQQRATAQASRCLDGGDIFKTRLCNWDYHEGLKNDLEKCIATQLLVRAGAAAKSALFQRARPACMQNTVHLGMTT